MRQPRIAFLGPLYSFSHLAAIHRFGQSVEFVPVGTIAAVFEEVHRKQSDFGLVPVENSTDGRVADTLDMFTRLPVRICGEVETAHPSHRCWPNARGAEVPRGLQQAAGLSQCRNWLAKHLPAARTIEVTSTSTAAQLAAEKPGAAAIASLQAGMHYGLDVLAENIEDNPAQHHPLCRDRRPSSRPDRQRPHGHAVPDRAHRPGALADAMNVFKRNKLNLTWIESFPVSRARSGDYLFFVEIEAHETDAAFRRAVAALESKSRAAGDPRVVSGDGGGGMSRWFELESGVRS